MERDSLAGPIQPTALTQVGEHGYHGTSAQRIADALGVTRAAFPSKKRPSGKPLILAAAQSVLQSTAAVR